MHHGMGLEESCVSPALVDERGFCLTPTDVLRFAQIEQNVPEEKEHRDE